MRFAGVGSFGVGVVPAIHRVGGDGIRCGQGWSGHELRQSGGSVTGRAMNTINETSTCARVRKRYGVLLGDGDGLINQPRLRGPAGCQWFRAALACPAARPTTWNEFVPMSKTRRRR